MKTDKTCKPTVKRNLTPIKETESLAANKETLFGAVLFEKEYDAGLTVNEAKELIDMLPANEEIIPLEIQGSVNGVAMGFITEPAGDRIDYEYKPGQAFHEYIASILDDMTLSSEDGTYEFRGLRIFLKTR